MNAQCAAVIVAGGSGIRAGGDLPKQFQPLLGLPLFLWAVRFFVSRAEVAETILVVHPGWLQEAAEMLETRLPGSGVRIVPGGKRRQDSVLGGVEATGEDLPVVAVHDAARPFPPENLGEGIEVALREGGAIFAARVTDSVKKARSGLIEASVPRENLWAAQTPQLARRDVLLHALRDMAARGVEVTDEASALELAGQPVALIESSRTNLKVTLPEDWLLAETIARSRSLAG